MYQSISKALTFTANVMQFFDSLVSLWTLWRGRHAEKLQPDVTNEGSHNSIKEVRYAEICVFVNNRIFIFNIFLCTFVVTCRILAARNLLHAGSSHLQSRRNLVRGRKILGSTSFGGACGDSVYCAAGCHLCSSHTCSRCLNPHLSLSASIYSMEIQVMCDCDKDERAQHHNTLELHQWPESSDGTCSDGPATFMKSTLSGCVRS